MFPKGLALLRDPTLNKSTAFNDAERDALGIRGLLPPHVSSQEEQVARVLENFRRKPTALEKYIDLTALHDRNEALFFRILVDNPDEMLPVIYTPTVGEAVQRFSLEHRKARGLYISYTDRNNITAIFDRQLPTDIDLSVVTDGEAVLGIGDQGIGGINISSAKLMVYTLCGGINPHRVLPIQLDVGTNNQHLLNDPMYLGWRHERITGQAYDDFIDEFVRIFTKKFPS